MGMHTTPSTCYVNLAAIVRNFRKLGEPDTLLPVIKSDAYGHGLSEVGMVLGRAGATRFAVGLVDEGSTLRQFGNRQDIFILMGCLGADDWEVAMRYELTPLVGSFDDLRNARDLLKRYPGKKQPVAIKVDTGMSRLGFELQEAGAVLDFLRQNPDLEPKMVVSHLACADDPAEEEFTSGQLRKFDEFYSVLSPAYPDLLRSAGNSAATIAGKGHDIGRPGLALYGGNPLEGSTGPDLEWAMSVSSPIIHIRDLKPGQSVSYGRIFTPEKPTRIAIVACGYANGFNRRLSNRARALVNGKSVPEVGRVCMSMSCLDITGHENVKVGDAAWIMGGEGEHPVTPLEMANTLDTIPYEILCLMGELNPRVYNM